MSRRTKKEHGAQWAEERPFRRRNWKKGGVMKEPGGADTVRLPTQLRQQNNRMQPNNSGSVGDLFYNFHWTRRKSQITNHIKHSTTGEIIDTETLNGKVRALHYHRHCQSAFSIHFIFTSIISTSSTYIYACRSGSPLFGLFFLREEGVFFS